MGKRLLLLLIDSGIKLYVGVLRYHFRGGLSFHAAWIIFSSNAPVFNLFLKNSIYVDRMLICSALKNRMISDCIQLL